MAEPAEIEVRTESADALNAYAEIPTAFLVTSTLHPVPSARDVSGFTLDERPVHLPYIKNYDAIPGNRPSDWTQHFDTTHWKLFSAFQDGTRIGGAIAFTTPSLDPARGSYADLWDLRVDPTARRMHIGSVLFRAVERWAVESGCGALRIETQHINVVACQFYERQGCTLFSVRAGAYPDLPDEIRLIWCKAL